MTAIRVIHQRRSIYQLLFQFVIEIKTIFLRKRKRRDQQFGMILQCVRMRRAQPSGDCYKMIIQRQRSLQQTPHHVIQGARDIFGVTIIISQ